MKAKIILTISRVLIFICFTALLLMPLGCIYLITNLEIKQNSTMTVPAISQKSYGTPYPVMRLDMREFVTVSGTYASNDTVFMELPKLKNTYSARMLVEQGDYIEAEELIGYSEDGSKEIRATESGVVREIHLGQWSYIKLDRVDSLVLRCFVPSNVLSSLTNNADTLTDSSGDSVELVEAAKTVSPNGTEVLLGLSGGMYGETAKDVKLYTGRVYTQALVANAQCLFHLSTDDETWYVRIVDENGNVLGTQAVQAGFSDGEYTCISGIPEGTLLDSGYAQILGEKS